MQVLVSRLVNVHNTTDLSLDLACGSCPVERLGRLIPVREVTVDRSLERANAVEAATSDRLARDQGKPSLDQIEPRGARRRVVDMEARIGGKPLAYGRMFVRPVVVADETDVPTGVLPFDGVEEANELQVGGLGKAVAVHLSAGHLQGREQARRAILL